MKNNTSLLKFDFGSPSSQLNLGSPSYSVPNFSLGSGGIGLDFAKATSGSSIVKKIFDTVFQIPKDLRQLGDSDDLAGILQGLVGLAGTIVKGFF